jgi:hypothetical protein
LELLSIQRESELLEAAIAENEIKQHQGDKKKKVTRYVLFSDLKDSYGYNKTFF